jgi:16S rRNA (guanine527-N7)-methyltransferase
MTESVDLQQSLAAEIERAGLEVPPESLPGLANYCRLLWDWNTKLNLTRHVTPEQFVTRDLVDTLSVARFIEPGQRVLDLGSGGGVPGIPLGIIRTDLRVELCESVEKKARVLKEIVRDLGLKWPVHHARAETLLKRAHYDVVVVRAVAPLPKLLNWLQLCWDNMGRLLIIKGPRWVEERGEARHLGLMQGLELRKLLEYPLAGTEAQSVVLQIWPKSG